MGVAPLPAHVLPDLSRYLIAAFRPFNELRRRFFPERISPPNLESWACNSFALRLRTFQMSSRSFRSASTDIEAKLVLAILISFQWPIYRSPSNEQTSIHISPACQLVH